MSKNDAYKSKVLWIVDTWLNCEKQPIMLNIKIRVHTLKNRKRKDNVKSLKKLTYNKKGMRFCVHFKKILMS